MIENKRTPADEGIDEARADYRDMLNEAAEKLGEPELAPCGQPSPCECQKDNICAGCHQPGYGCGLQDGLCYACLAEANADRDGPETDEPQTEAGKLWMAASEKANQTDPDDDDPEACPGCGCKPGDGITDDCDDPDGCGFYSDDDDKEIEASYDWGTEYYIRKI